ncbi:MAG TPA: hypothetical protein VE136_00105, partial [Anaerolineales bacterium]|nr:hypothetical protein [Anaerolineales bacterium]
IFSVAFFLLFIPLFAIPMLPETWRAQAINWLMQNSGRISVGTVVLAVAGVLLLIDIALVVAAMARFRRARLIID